MSARFARGGVSWVTLLLLALLLGGAYLAWTFGPIYIVHFQVKQVVRDYLNQAVKDRDDASLKERMLHKLRVLETRRGVDRAGNVVEIPSVQVRSEDVTWERNTSSSPPTLRVAFCYDRVVEFPLIHRTTSRTLCVDLGGDLSLPDWGPTR